MESEKFDALIRQLFNDSSRRTAVRIGIGTLIASTLTAVGLWSEQAESKKKKRKERNREKKRRFEKEKTTLVSAASDPGADPVVLVIGSNSRRDCDVLTEDAEDDDRDFIRARSVGPVACEGGLVSSIPTTRAEAERILNERGIGQSLSRDRSLASDEGDLLLGEIIPLSGNQEEDETAVLNKEEEFHNTFMELAPEPEEPPQSNPTINGTIAARAKRCRQGKTGDRRRRTMRYKNVENGNILIRVQVAYRRETCQHWRITDVHTRLMSGTREVRAGSYTYELARLYDNPGGPFGQTTYDYQCRELPLQQTVDAGSSGRWMIITKEDFGHASYIESDHYPDRRCQWNGWVHTTGEVKLSGPSH